MVWLEKYQPTTKALQIGRPNQVRKSSVFLAHTITDAKSHHCAIICALTKVNDNTFQELALPASFEYVTQSLLPTKYGDFDILVFEHKDTRQEHVMLSYNLPKDDGAPTLIRLHSECLTGDTFGSLRCDCGPQLHAAMARIQEEGSGAILYLRQEGRGIGLTNKIRAYALQDQGHDTLDANLLLGLPGDGRTYDMCKAMLDHVGVSKVRLMTNNSHKIKELESIGVEVVERVPLYVGLQPLNEHYIFTKKTRMGHLD